MKLNLEAEIRDLLERCSGADTIHIQVEISATDPSCATVGIRPLRQIDHLAAAESCLAVLRESGYLIIKQPHRASSRKTAFTVRKAAV